MITLSKSRAFSAFRFEGRIFDTGTKLGFLAANVIYALERTDLGPALRKELRASLAADRE